MITAIVNFDMPEPVTRDEAARIFESTAPKYLKLQGLIRKYYIVSEDGKTAGGVYLWDSAEAAANIYTGEWRAMVTQKYGTEPRISMFHTPVIVDNLTGGITKSET